MEIKRGYWWRRDGGLAYVCHRTAENGVWQGVVFIAGGFAERSITWYESGRYSYDDNDGNNLVEFAGEECPTTFTRPESEPQYVPWDVETFPKDRPVWVDNGVRDHFSQIAIYNKRGVYLYWATLSWQELFEQVKQHDGTPCGRRVE